MNLNVGVLPHPAPQFTDVFLSPHSFQLPCSFFAKAVAKSLFGRRAVPGADAFGSEEVWWCDNRAGEGSLWSWEPVNINVNDGVGIRKWHPKAWRFGMRRGLRGIALVSRLNLGIHCLYVRERFSGVSSHALGPQKGDQLPLPEISTSNKRLNTGHDGTGTYSQPGEGRRIT